VQIMSLYHKGFLDREIIDKRYLYSLSETEEEFTPNNRTKAEDSSRKQWQTACYIGDKLLAARTFTYGAQEKAWRYRCMNAAPDCRFEIYQDPKTVKSISLRQQKLVPKPRNNGIQYRDMSYGCAIHWWGCTKVSIIESLLKSEFGFTNYRDATKEQITELYNKYHLTYPAKMVG